MTPSRRQVGALLVGGVAAACAIAPPRRPPVISINLAGSLPPDENTSTRLETAFDSAQRMTVPVELAGRGPFQFVVDTGANHTVVSIETAGRCNLTAAGTTPVHGIVGTQPAPLVRAPRLRVGQVQSRNLSLPVLPRASLGADGLLGIDVLKGRRIRLDFARNAFEVGPSGAGAQVNALGGGGGTRIRDPSAGVVVPAQYRSGQLVIFDADVDGVPVRAFLDSGAQITCGNQALRAALAQHRPAWGQRMVDTQLISATGQTSPAQLAILPQLRLGGVGLNNVRAAFAGLHIFNLWGLNAQPAMLVGVDVLRRFEAVVLDFGRREVTFHHAARGRVG